MELCTVSALSFDVELAGKSSSELPGRRKIENLKRNIGAGSDEKVNVIRSNSCPDDVFG